MESAIKPAIEAGVRLGMLPSDRTPEECGQWAARTYTLTTAEGVAVASEVARRVAELRSRQGGVA